MRLNCRKVTHSHCGLQTSSKNRLPPFPSTFFFSVRFDILLNPAEGQKGSEERLAGLCFLLLLHDSPSPGQRNNRPAYQLPASVLLLTHRQTCHILRFGCVPPRAAETLVGSVAHILTCLPRCCLLFSSSWGGYKSVVSLKSCEGDPVALPT